MQFCSRYAGLAGAPGKQCRHIGCTECRSCSGELSSVTVCVAVHPAQRTCESTCSTSHAQLCANRKRERRWTTEDRVGLLTVERLCSRRCSAHMRKALSRGAVLRLCTSIAHDKNAASSAAYP
ncbi:unnamed protein product [Rangifer tarandus platyrhynchus]|uniref:Uncharacterized protein n=1 Tax=Rangifer tarandus platyrhynchus TaxID=3082113 RepID=A0ACB1KG77_RANTA